MVDLGNNPSADDSNDPLRELGMKGFGVPTLTFKPCLEKANQLWDETYHNQLDDLVRDCKANPEYRHQIVLDLNQQLSNASVNQTLHLCRTICYLGLSSKTFFNLFHESLSKCAQRIDQDTPNDEEYDSVDFYEPAWREKFCIDALTVLSGEDFKEAAGSRAILIYKEVIPLIVAALTELDGEENEHELLGPEAIAYQKRNSVYTILEAGMFDFCRAINQEFSRCLLDQLQEFITKNQTVSPGITALMSSLADGVYDFNRTDLASELLLSLNNFGQAKDDSPYMRAVLVGETCNAVVEYLRLLGNESGCDETFSYTFLHACEKVLGQTYQSGPPFCFDKLITIVCFASEFPVLNDFMKSKLDEFTPTRVKSDPQFISTFFYTLLDTADAHSVVMDAIARSSMGTLIHTYASDIKDEELYRRAQELLEESIFASRNIDLVIESYLVGLSWRTEAELVAGIDIICERLAELAKQIEEGDGEDENAVVASFLGRLRSIFSRVEKDREVDIGIINQFTRILDVISTFPDEVFYTDMSHTDFRDCIVRLEEFYPTAAIFSDTTQSHVFEKVNSLFRNQPWQVILDSLPENLKLDREIIEIGDGAKITFVEIPPGVQEDTALYVTLGKALSGIEEPLLLVDPSQETSELLRKGIIYADNELGEMLYINSMYNLGFSTDEEWSNYFSAFFSNAINSVPSSSKAAIVFKDSKKKEGWKDSYGDLNPDLVILPITPNGRVGLYSSKDELNQHIDGNVPINNSNTALGIENLNAISASSMGLDTVSSAKKALFFLTSPDSEECIRELLEAADDYNFEKPISRAISHNDALIFIPSGLYRELFD